MAELLFEIFCEEIPAGMQVRAGANLAKAITDGLIKAGLTVADGQILTGPRRLVFTADIPLRSPDISEERKGPRTSAPQQALAGFMRGAGLTDISQAETRTDKKGEFYVAIIEQSGREAGEILAEVIPDVMNNFPWPKSMKSGMSDFKWVRPLTSMICLLDGKTVPFEVGGIPTGNTTEGHRRMGRGPFTISDFTDYKKTLEGKGKVVLDAEARKALILDGAQKACAAKGLELVDDEGLLAEVAGLVEYPVVILGDMDPEFLKLPGEVIRLSMRTHQKYFAVRDPKTGDLAPNFIVVANQVAPDGGTAIAQGNSRVLSARLSDALFFEQQDAKQNLSDYYDKLGTVVFHQKLGSVKDKSERVAALAKELAPKVGADADTAFEAAKLAKCDLVTNMVIEFTSLQGQIGRMMYANEMKDGGDGNADIALAIEEHYKPQGPSDAVPTNPVSIAVALADKLDTLVGFWAIDEKPTGSKDPYALRRAALGLVRVLLENNIRTELKSEIWQAYQIFLRSQIRSPNWSFYRASDPRKDLEEFWEKFDYERGVFLVNASFDDDCLILDDAAAFHDNKTEAVWASGKRVHTDLLAFILDRLKVFLRDDGIRHDVIDAVFSLGGDDLVSITNRTRALQAFLDSSEGADLLAGYKRATNILRAEAKKGDLPSGTPSAGTDLAEQALHAALIKIQPEIDKSLDVEDYAAAMTALSSVRGAIDSFFDGVMVNSDKPEERVNRLQLLGMLKETASRIANFDKVDG